MLHTTENIEVYLSFAPWTGPIGLEMSWESCHENGKHGSVEMNENNNNLTREGQHKRVAHNNVLSRDNNTAASLPGGKFPLSLFTKTLFHLGVGAYF